MNIRSFGTDQQYILCVDDQESNLIALEVALELDEHVQLVKAHSGEEALQAALKQDFSLILLDVQMPGMDGFEVAEILRSSKRTATIPLVFLTAINKDNSFVFRGYDAGAIDYLFKPYEPRVIRSKVLSLLALDQTQRKLKESLATLQRERDERARLLRSLGEGVVSTDLDGKIQYTNPAFCNMLGRDVKELVSTDLSHYFELQGEYAELKDVSEASLAPHLAQDNDSLRCCANLTKDGETLNLSIAVSRMAQSGRAYGFVYAIQDITAQVTYEKKLSQMAEYDYLTGLANRYLFTDTLSQAVARSARSQRPMALLFIDLDGFKSVNDQFGHDVGDGLLKMVSQRVVQHVRRGDVVARLGGDEFTVLIEDVIDDEHVAVVADKIIDVLSQPFEVLGHSLQIGASIGVVCEVAEESDGDNFVRQADQAMYDAKHKGKNQYCIFSA